MGKLQISNFQNKVNIPQTEHDVLEFWEDTQAFERSVSERNETKRYVFYDGPPFATGLPHYGHILASTIKDVVPRYWTMKGYRVERVWGWDCHGIPIENMIEKELDLKGGKKGIEELGIDKFNQACRAAILRFDKEWEKVIRRIGRWVDFKNSYKTMDTSFMESVWWAFKQLHEKELVYEGRKVILYCPRCATPLSNFEIAMDNSYKELPGPSTTYKYKVVDQENTYLLAWSTTPWNKIATPALAVNPTLEYVKVKQGDEHYILAKSTLKMLKNEPYEIVESYVGKDLEKFRFEVHYSFYPALPQEKSGVVIADDYVTDGEGTGIVTLAIYGEDDYRVMTKHGVQLIEHVDSEGKLKSEVTPWAGMFMLKVNQLVNEDLAKRNLIYSDEERVHNVPVCYRCETRLYHAPVPAWFIDIQKLKPELIAQNEHINWYPQHLKHGRFGKGLETAPDWNISRSRYWGTPMPVWKEEKIEDKRKMISYGDPQMRIIGSVEELKKWAVDQDRVKNITDIHREFIDDIEVWVDDARTIKGKRIPEVFDCWIESGSMPYASIHYPFDNKNLFEESHPAQFIAEYIAQTRAWFYTLHVMSVGLFGKHTFENAVTTGTILAEDGAKMSKSKKNYPDPSLLFEQYGVDALRFYLMGSVVMKGENLNFSESEVREIYNKVVSLVWNTFSFYKLYANNTKPELPEKLDHILDQWIVSKTMQLIKNVTEAMDGYDTVKTCRLLKEFIDDLSNWYLRRSRERFKEGSDSIAVFGWVLKQLILLLSPITPFIAEVMHQNLEPGESVHLQKWPEYNERYINLSLEKQMITIRTIVESIHSLRKKHNVPIKQPLEWWAVPQFTEHSFEDHMDQMVKLVNEETNILAFKAGTDLPTQDVDSAEFQAFHLESAAQVSVSFAITPELENLRKVRELVREIQSLRKELGCHLDDRISLVLPKEYESWLSGDLLTKVQKQTLADSVTWGDKLVILTG